MSDLRLTQPMMSGPLVRQLQQRLTADGFGTGGIDGVFGRQTDTAVRAFQKSKGLAVDGVAGHDTLAALGIKQQPAPAPGPGTGKLTVQQIASVLGCSVDAVQANWPPILAALHAHGMDSFPCQVATIATIGTEVPHFEPINEMNTNAFFESHYQGRMGNVHPGDGIRYHGRGYIQLTGRDNYRTYGAKVGAPLEQNPELALQPDIASKVLVAYFADHAIGRLATSGDWIGVRKAVNGGTWGLERFQELVQGLEAAAH